MPKPQDKPFDIPKQLVWDAWRQVAANKGAPGVDNETLGEFARLIAANDNRSQGRYDD